MGTAFPLTPEAQVIFANRTGTPMTSGSTKLPKLLPLLSLSAMLFLALQPAQAQGDDSLETKDGDSSPWSLGGWFLPGPRSFHYWRREGFA